MGTRNQHGFTIIETLLFLGITGLLAITLLAGWTTMINTQRYRDSVKTLQSFVQQQYNLVYNVQNSRSSVDTGCVAGGASEPVFSNEASDANPQGQSTCVVMGRYIRISDGTKVNVYPIIGNDIDDRDNPVAADRNDILGRYPKVVEQDTGLTESKLGIPWQAEVVEPVPDSENRMDMVIVIIRSPKSGAVHTYSYRSSGMPTVADVITNYPGGDTNLCLNPGAPLTGGRMGVVIRAGASSQSSVQTIPDGEGPC